MIMKHFDSIILQEDIAVIDSNFEMERKQYQHKESNLKKDLELANKVRISDTSNDKSDLDLTSNVDDQTIGACTSNVDLSTESNTPTIMSQTSYPTTADVEKRLQVQLHQYQTSIPSQISTFDIQNTPKPKHKHLADKSQIMPCLTKMSSTTRTIKSWPFRISNKGKSKEHIIVNPFTVL